MKDILLVSTVLLAGSLFAAPVVTLGKLSSNAGKVTVRYTLANEPAVITCDVETESEGVWTSLGVATLRTATGEVNQLVQPGSSLHKISLGPVEGVSDELVRNGKVRATLTAWATNCPPDYLVIDLKDKTAAPKYYLTAEWIPGSVTNRIYKTDKIVLRKIHAAGEFGLLGSPKDEVNPLDAEDVHNQIYEGFRRVGFSRDFYLGVFMMTLGQVKNIEGDSTLTTRCYKDPSLQPDEDALPYTSASWAGWRQVMAANQMPLRPPTPTGIFADLRRNYGFTADLPSVAEYEFAARAGKTGPFVCAAEDVDDYIWSVRNSEGVVHAVGTLKPNGWGLYDVQGNVIELLYDIQGARMADSTAATIAMQLDPYIGIEKGEGGGEDSRFRRLGTFNVQPYRLANAPASHIPPYSVSGDNQGARVRMPALAVR